MTNDELQAIRARCEAATPGPWQNLLPSVGIDKNNHVTDSVDSMVVHCFGFNHSVDEVSKRNAIFIAASRTDIPSLLAHIDRQRRALEWFAEKTAHACATAVGCPFTEPCPAEGTRCLDIEAEDWLKISLNATKETIREQDK